MLTKAVFKISGMHCTSCAMNIDFDLEDTSGVTEAKTNYAKQQTEVTFDEEKITPQQLVEIIKKAGYDAFVSLG